MSSIIVKETARRISDIRKQRGLSAEVVAEKAKMTRATYYRYEAGDVKNMKLDKIQSIADVLGIHPVDLVVWEDDEKLALENESELQELISIFRDLDASRRTKLLELSRLYLNDQRRSEEK